MSWKGAETRVPGDVIIMDDHNILLAALDGLFEYVHVEGRPQPFQVNKPSILLLLAEGTATIGFPNTIHIFLSSDNEIFEEVAALDLPLDGETHVASLTVPVPKDYWIYWTAAYGFVKSAVLF